MLLIYFLSHLLSSVCSLSALITTVYKSHRPICGLVISQKPSAWVFLLAKKKGLRARIINLFYSFDCALLSPAVSSHKKKDFFFLPL